MNKRIISAHHRLTLWYVVQTGWNFAKKTFWLVFPLSLLMSMIGYVIQPNTIPAFTEWADWVALFILATGILALSALHGAIFARMNGIVHGQNFDWKKTIEIGLDKSISVFVVWLLYVSLIILALLLFVKTARLGETLAETITHPLISFPIVMPVLGFIVFIIPAIIISISLYLTIFIAVIAEHKNETPWYKKIFDYFRESALLIRGHWWKMFGLLLMFTVIMAIVDRICQVLQKEVVVFSVLFCVFARAAILPFWYGCILAMLLELKARRLQIHEPLEPTILKKV